MNMVNVNDQLASVAQIARRCPTPTLQRAYMRAMREWCQQSQWLRTNIPGITTPGIRQYAIGAATGLDVVGVAAIQGQAINGNGQPQEWSMTTSDSSRWDPNMVQGQPVRFQYVPEMQFALDPVPKLAYNLLISIIIVPTETAIQIPSTPLVKYSGDIEAGALGYLLAIPGQPWSSPVEAAKYMMQFQNGIANGKAEQQRSYNVGSRRAVPRQFII